MFCRGCHMTLRNTAHCTPELVIGTLMWCNVKFVLCNPPNFPSVSRSLDTCTMSRSAEQSYTTTWIPAFKLSNNSSTWIDASTMQMGICATNFIWSWRGTLVKYRLQSSILPCFLQFRRLSIWFRVYKRVFLRDISYINRWIAVSGCARAGVKRGNMCTIKAPRRTLVNSGRARLVKNLRTTIKGGGKGMVSIAQGKRRARTIALPGGKGKKTLVIARKGVVSTPPTSIDKKVPVKNAAVKKSVLPVKSDMVKEKTSPVKSTAIKKIAPVKSAAIKETSPVKSTAIKKTSPGKSAAIKKTSSVKSVAKTTPLLPRVPKRPPSTTCFKPPCPVKRVEPATRVYVLLLEGDYVYVGQSTSVERRIQQHLDGKGAAFTKRHKPVARIPRLGTVEGAGDAGEREEVLLQMQKRGMEKVRGWKYCSEKLSPAQLKDIESNFVEMFSLCRICKRAGHMAANCKLGRRRA